MSAGRIVWRGVLLNLLNPKLPLFFVAFLPQFVPAGDPHATLVLAQLGGVFVAMTFAVFAVYAVVRRHVAPHASPRARARSRSCAGSSRARSPRSARASRCSEPEHADGQSEPEHLAHDRLVELRHDPLGRGQAVGAHRAEHRDAAQPGAERGDDADLGVLEGEHLAGGDVRARAGDARPRSRPVPACRAATSSAATISAIEPAIPAAASVASISLRAAPEQIATGTCSAARRTAARTCGGIVEPSAVRAR